MERLLTAMQCQMLKVSNVKEIKKVDQGYLFVGPCLMVYGNLHQGMMPGQYRGVQCTSMSLSAALFHLLLHKKRRYRPSHIDNIITEGHILHTILRDSLKLSVLPDGKVSIEDLPLKATTISVFDQQVIFQLTEPSQYVMTSNPAGEENFLSVRTYIEERLNGQRCGFLLTVEEYTYAILAWEDGGFDFFDSHGHLHCAGHRIVNRAGVLTFDTIGGLEAFIVHMYSDSTPALICQVSTISLAPKEVGATAEVEGQQNLKTDNIDADSSTMESPKDITCEEVVCTVGDQDVEDESPYVRMLGGGD